jgi:hypothetical protein
MRPSQQKSRYSDSLAIEAPRQVANIAPLGHPSRCNHYARENFAEFAAFRASSAVSRLKKAQRYRARRISEQPCA